MFCPLSYLRHNAEPFSPQFLLRKQRGFHPLQVSVHLDVRLDRSLGVAYRTPSPPGSFMLPLCNHGRTSRLCPQISVHHPACGLHPSPRWHSQELGTHSKSKLHFGHHCWAQWTRHHEMSASRLLGQRMNTRYSVLKSSGAMSSLHVPLSLQPGLTTLQGQWQHLLIGFCFLSPSTSNSCTQSWFQAGSPQVTGLCKILQQCPTVSSRPPTCRGRFPSDLCVAPK